MGMSTMDAMIPGRGDSKRRAGAQLEPKKWLKPYLEESETGMAGTDLGMNMGGFSKNMSWLWLEDSGASCHMTFEEEGMFDC
jgi:hypothetical protein